MRDPTPASHIFNIIDQTIALIHMSMNLGVIAFLLPIPQLSTETMVIVSGGSSPNTFLFFKKQIKYLNVVLIIDQIPLLLMLSLCLLKSFRSNFCYLDTHFKCYK